VEQEPAEQEGQSEAPEVIRGEDADTEPENAGPKTGRQLGEAKASRCRVADHRLMLSQARLGAAPHNRGKKAGVVAA